MIRYILILCISSLVLSSCQTQTRDALSDSPQTITLRETLSGAITEHNQRFREYPMVLNDMSPQNRAETEASHRDSLRNLDEQYRTYTAGIGGETGAITYLEKPTPIDNLGFFTRGELPGYISGRYGESTGAYLHVADITLYDGSVSRLISVGIYGFMMHPATLYFVERDGVYTFLPSISYGISETGSGETRTIEQILFIERQLVKEGVHIFDEKRFLGLFGSAFSLPDKVSFSENGKSYTLDLVGRERTLFSQKNLRKLDRLSVQLGKNAYIEQSGDKEWYSPESQEIEKIWSNPDYEANNREWMKLPEATRAKYTLEKEQMQLYSSDAVYVEMPDHTSALYMLEVPFELQGDEEARIQLNKDNGKTMLLKNYGYSDSEGCGVKDGTFFNIPDGVFRFEKMHILMSRIRDDAVQWRDKLPQDIPDSETIFRYQDSDLMRIGTTGSGEELLFFRDTDHPFLKAMYEYGYRSGYDEGICDVTSGTCKNPSYDAYVETLPLWFWRDPFGRLVMFVSYSTMMPSACAAKPVIYLYPEETTDISVTLDWEKQSLISIPSYDDGWHVTATPEGQITNRDRAYPYLFWEDTISYNTPTTGFIVEQTGLSDFLDTKLSLLGLNDRERADFKVYWLPIMQDSPYYRISFITTEQMNISAPITIIPKPDTIQRVFMDWSELTKPITLKEQYLTPFIRSGFSVIEWGGKRH